MKELLKKVTRAGGMLMAGSLWSVSMLAQGAPISGTAVVSLDPRAGTVNVGSNVQADVVVNLTGVTGTGPTGVTPAVLGSYVIDVTFDSSKLQYLSVSGGTTSEFAGSPTVNASNAASGTVRITAVQNSASSPTGKVFVAAVTFKGLAAGSASLNASASSLSTAFQPPDKGPVAIPSTSQSKSVTVQAPVVNSPPVLTNPGAKSNAEGANISLQLSATDPNGDSLTYSATNLPPGLSVSASGLITGTLSFTSAGVHNVNASVSDGKGGSDSESFTWTVTDTNRNPALTNPGAQNAIAGSAVSLQISGSDPDGDALTWSATGLPAGLSINTSSGLISGTLSSTANQASPYSVTVTVSDGKGGIQNISFSWIVAPVSCPQVATPSLSVPNIVFSGESITISWTAVPGATEYELQRSDSSTFATVTSIKRPAGTTSYQTVEYANDDRTVYFRIRARAVSGSCDTYGNFSTVRTVLVRARQTTTPPGVPAQPSPADGALAVGLPVTLSWAPAAGASSYDVRFGTTSPPAFAASTSGTSFAVTAAANTTYYWSVRSINSAGTAEGPVWTFTTNGNDCVPPPAPQLLGPADAEAGATYLLRWTQSPGATEYIIEKAASPDFAGAATFTAGGSESSRAFSASEPPGSTVYFRMKARVVSAACTAESSYSAPLSTSIAANASFASIRIIPVVTSGPGAFGSFFRTTMQLHNRGLEPSSGKIVFHPRGVPGRETDPFITYSLDPGETKHIVDLVASMGQEGSGSADLISLTGTMPRVVVRVFNDAGAAGTTGTNQPAFSPDRALQAGDRVILITPPDATRERFNVGVRTLDVGVELAIAVRTADGVRAASAPRAYPPIFFNQTSAEDFAGVSLPDNSVIEIDVLSGSAIVYGSATDNVTQDPSMQILARE